MTQPAPPLYPLYPNGAPPLYPPGTAPPTLPPGGAYPDSPAPPLQPIPDYPPAYQGQPGPPGPSGPEGPKGDPGTDGTTGAQGELGPTGPQGVDGPAGPPGLAGAPGTPGVPGPAGETGPVGPKGDTGATGADSTVAGPQGPPGATGATGSAGADSTVPGPQGPAGATGAQGIQGPTGATGAASTVPGPPGATGATGSQGPQGIQGATGATGSQGPKGDTGDTGAQGIQGIPGTTGAQGPKGDTGTQGVQGIPGTPGATGSTGSQGPAGPGVPVGGTATQVLTKTSAVDYATAWQNPAAGGITLPLTQNLTFSPDSTYDIGATASTLRPRNLYLAGTLNTPGAITDAAGLHVRNGTTPMGLHIYNTYTDASNYERFRIFWGANQVVIENQAVGTGVARPMIYNAGPNVGFFTSGSAIRLQINSATKWGVEGTDGHWVPGNHNTHDIGWPTQAPRDIYVGRKILGDFSGYTLLTDRVAFQTTTANGHTGVTAMPNGTGRTAVFSTHDRSDLTNSSYLNVGTDGTAVVIDSGKLGTAPYLPLTVTVGGALRMRIEASGRTEILGTTRLSGTQDGTNVPTTGAGLEFVYQAGLGSNALGLAAVTSYNRTSTAYTDMQLDGQRITLYARGAGEKVFVESAAGLQINNNALAWYGDCFLYRSGANHLSMTTGSQFGIGGVNVATNGVIASFHGNIYGGVYYSTTGAFATWPSQREFKLDIKPLPAPLSALADPLLRGMSYIMRDPKFDNGKVTPGEPHSYRTYGVIVEDWQTAFPELVVGHEGEVKGFNTNGLIPVMWEMMRQLYAEIQTLKGAA